MHEFEADAAVRADVFVSERTGLTRSAVKKLADEGRLFADGVPVKAGHVLKIGSRVALEIPQPRPVRAEPEDLPVEVLYEDGDIAVINKPRGMAVHAGAGRVNGTLVNALLYRLQSLSSINGEIRPGIVHRIDKDTTGLLVVAENDAAHLSLAKQIAEKTCRREYLALLEGVLKEDAGKSSLVNRLLGQERTIVTPVAGTTRDAVDTRFEREGRAYTIIDTAGIRRKRSVEDDVEYYSVLRAFDAVRRADVCLLVVDAQEGITEQDVKIIGYVHEQGKPSVIVMNKWDLIEKDTHTVEKFEAKLKEELKFMDYFRSAYVSAKTGQRTDRLLALAGEVYAHAGFRVPTGDLNDLLMDAMRVSEPPSYQGRRMKLYYASQVAVHPPLFVLMVNDEGLLHFSYERYLENVIRGAYDFSGTPIRIKVRNKKENE